MHQEETLAGNRNHIDFFLGQFCRRRRFQGLLSEHRTFLSVSPLLLTQQLTLFIQWAFPDTDTDPVLFNRVSHSMWVTFPSNLKLFNHLGKFLVWKAAVIFLSLLYSYLQVLGPFLFPLVLHFLHLLPHPILSFSHPVHLSSFKDSPSLYFP